MMAAVRLRDRVLIAALYLAWLAVILLVGWEIGL